LGKRRLTSVYVDDEKMRMLKALGISLTQIVNEALDYAIVDRFDEYKEKLKKRIEKAIEAKEKPKSLKEIANKPIY